MKGPKFLKYINPVLSVLQANGGVGNSSDTINQEIEDLNISEEELSEITSNGQSRVRNQINWARFYLFKAGLIDNSERGLWRLTKEGIDAKLNDEGVYKLFKGVQENVRKSKKKENAKDDQIIFDEESTEDEEHSAILLNLIKELSPKGFERLCKRLLTEIGIKDITITGRSNDQG